MHAEAAPNNRYRHISVQPLSGALGANVSGVDPGDDLDDEVIAEIRDAWLRYLVIFFETHDLSSERFLSFASRFAEPVAYPMLAGLPGFPHITEVRKLPGDRHNFGGLWHSDTAYIETPPMAAMLLARDVPACGGDTLFANMYIAFENLSPALQTLLAGLSAINASDREAVSLTRSESADRQSAPRQRFQAIHPVVRKHPETGRASLYVNGAHTSHFEGMTEAESRPLLDWLCEHQTRPEFTCRFRWRKGSLAFWDNRVCQHFPLNDYPGEARLMHRISLGAEQPVSV